MQKQKGHRVNFRISHCSSEDPQYPASQLLLQSATCKGWQSKRFCQYPQSIVYQLVQPTILKQISILSHQSKIATKVIIHNKLEANKDWHKLGYMSLQSNVNSNYQARELKTVNLNDKPTIMLKFTFQANYVNTHNVFNQVGVISLCIFGDSMVSGQQNPKSIGAPNRIGSSGGINIDKFDKGTIAKLKQLQVQKKMAIDSEDYDEAQRIKQQLDRIKKIGNTLIALEQKKKQAVNNQDYETAKLINNKIKQLRDSSGGGPNFSMRPSGTPSDYFRQKKTVEYQDDAPSISPMTQTKGVQKKQPVYQPKRKSPLKKEQFHEDRPISVKNTNPYQDAVDTGKFPGGQQAQQGQVQPLTKQIRGQCQRYFNIFDEQIFQHLFSHNHAHRQRGLNMVKDQLMGNPANKMQMTEALLYVIRKMIDDKNAAVLASTLDLFNMGMKKLRPSPGHYSQTAQQILEKMNDYLGHTNEKIKRTTEEIYHNLPQYQLTNKDVCYKTLTVLGKRDKPPKILTGRLKMLDTIVGNYQLGKNYDNVINFAVKYADDKNSDVRNSAIALICTISDQIGYGTMQPFLKSLRPQILKSIQQKVQEGGVQDDRNFQDKPLPTQNKKAQHLPIKHQKHEQFQAAQNQFIDVPPPKNISNPEYTCQFCERFDKRFQNQDYRDLHLFNACPMLTICDQCSQAIQINTLTAHRLSQCQNSKYYKKCPRCKEAVHQRGYKAHVQRKQCIPGKGLAVANRCPLCHLDIDPGRDGWLRHLVEEGCENQSRK